MRRVLTVAEMRAAEAAADAAGLPSALLMENAGRALADVALAEAGPQAHLVVLCGHGNNGGDGLVAARFLHAAGRSVQVSLVGPADRRSPDVVRNLRALEAHGLAPRPLAALAPPRAGDVVVDALLGTGLARAPAGDYAEALEALHAWHAAGARVVAADVPSGLPGDGGRPPGPCAPADVTVAFGALKPAHVVEPAASRCGRVVVADISLPAACLPAEAGGLLAPEAADARAALAPRTADSHKGTYGHVLVVAGSPGKTGAAALSALGALRGGAGLVSVAARPDVLPSILAHVPEAMGVALPGDGPLAEADAPALEAALAGKGAWVAGPGIPRGPGTGALLAHLLARTEVPAVLDADALNAVAEHPAALAGARVAPVLTPHPGEMARLAGRPTAEVQADRLAVARAYAAAHRVTLVLKGSRTLTVAPDGTAWANGTGNPGMATGGTGDVLAGLLGALVAAGVPAWAGVLVHGLAGDFAAARRGQRGLVASDLLDGLGEAWARWGR